MDAAVVLIDENELLPRELWAWLVRWRAGFRCEECGRQFAGDGKVTQRETRLNAHHIDLDGTNHRLSNGRSMCVKCHQALHRELAPVSREEVRARLKKAWETRRRNGTINSRFARMTAEEHSAKARKGAANRRKRERDAKGRFK